MAAAHVNAMERLLGTLCDDEQKKRNAGRRWHRRETYQASDQALDPAATTSSSKDYNREYDNEDHGHDNCDNEDSEYNYEETRLDTNSDFDTYKEPIHSDSDKETLVESREYKYNKDSEYDYE